MVMYSNYLKSISYSNSECNKMSADRLSEVISKNLEIIKKQAKNEPSEGKEESNGGDGDDNQEETPTDLVQKLPKLNRLICGEFVFSDNRVFFDDVYFRNSKLIKMYAILQQLAVLINI